MTRTRQHFRLARYDIARTIGRGLFPAAVTLTVLLSPRTWSQSAPTAPNAPWQCAQERSLEKEARSVVPTEFAVRPTANYSLGELIDLVEAHNPETRLAWEIARARADALAVC